MSSQKPMQSAEARFQQYQKEQAQFQELARNYEQLAAKNPEAHKGRIKRFMAFAYFVIFGMLILALAFIAGVIWFIVATGRIYSGEIKIIFIAGLFWLYLVRSLWVRLPDPKGYSLSRSEAPALWAEVDALTEKLQAPRVQQIILNLEFNAFAAHYRTHGFWGKQKTILGVGLPLLMSLSKDEFRYVLAHEFGHFSGRHGVFGSKVGTLSTTLDKMEDYYRSHGRGVLSGFLNWFQPRFNAMTLALRRQHEYEADNVAVQMTNKEAATSALLKLAFSGDWIDRKFWDPFARLTLTYPTPPVDRYRDLMNVTTSPIDQTIIERKVKAALKEKTDAYDSHPSLQDRIHAIGVAIEGRKDEYIADLANAEPKPASSVYLTDTGAILDRVGQNHAKEIVSAWEQARAKKLAQDRHIKDLTAQAERAPLKPEDAVEFAMLKRDLYEDQEAEEEALRIADAHPDIAIAQYAKGVILSDQNSLDSVPYFERAAKLDSAYTQACLTRIAEIKAEHGLFEQVEEIKQEYVREAIYDSAFDADMSNVRLTDILESSDLTQKELVDVKQAIAGTKNLGEAYLVVKRHPSYRDRKVQIVIAFSTKKFGASLRPNEVLRDELVARDFPTRVLIYCPGKDINAWKKKLQAVPNARIY